MPKTWTKEQLDILKAEYPTCGDTQELARRLNHPYSSICTKARTLGIKRVFRSGKYTRDNTTQYVIEHYNDYTNKEIAEQLGMTYQAVCALAFKLRLKKSPETVAAHRKGLFQKGQPAYNKGKKWEDFMSEEGMRESRKTQFKKGLIPANKAEIGHERIDIEGYTWVKIAEPDVFKPKHRVLWESVHGTIPKGHVILFKDGNKQNITIENLEMQTQAEHMRRNAYFQYPPAMRTAIIRLGKINRLIKKQNGKE